MSKQSLKQKGGKCARYYKNSIYSLLVTPLIFVLVILPVSPALALEEDISLVEFENIVDETKVILKEEPIQVGEDEIYVNKIEEFEKLTEMIDESISIESIETTEDVIVDEINALSIEYISDKNSAEIEEKIVDEIKVNDVAKIGTSTENIFYIQNEEQGTSTDEIDTEIDDVSTTTDITNQVVQNENTSNQDGETAASENSSDTEDEQNLQLEDITIEQDVEIMNDESGFDKELPIEVATVENVSYVINNKNKYQFGINDCVSVGDGSFYCNEDKLNGSVLEDEVFSAPDNDGDREIYIRKDGVEYKITNNNVDDLAPFYDPQSDRLVWHSLVNNRYQIITLDLNIGKEKQITSTEYNNMEPTAYGNITVWQSWIDNNWEIILYDGENTMRLTDNQGHDIAPYIRGNYIIWQTEVDNGWMVSIYDRVSNSIEYVEAGAGTEVKNPRFVLVYDSEKENGDIETIGYDIDNKTTIPLSSMPASIPKNIPEPDSTGEVRAIIQNKPPTEDDFVDIPDVDGDDNPSVPKIPQIISTSSSLHQDNDIVVSSIEKISTTTQGYIDSDIPTLDLSVSIINPNLEYDQSNSVNHASDLVIPKVDETE